MSKIDDKNKMLTWGACFPLIHYLYCEGTQIYDTPNQVIKNDMIDYNGMCLETMDTLKLQENGGGLFE